MRSTQRLQLLLSAGLAGLLLTALPVGFDGSTFGLTPAQAWAGNGHGNGHANGHAKVAGDSHGATASSLGALNAAHASENALLHASPNSRVGKIAIYKEAAIAAQADQAAADAAQAEADAAQAAADAAQAEADAEQTEADALVTSANEDGTVTAEEQAAIDAAQAEADAAQAEADAAQAGADTAQAEADAAQAAADAAQDEADDALVNAANKDITDEEDNVLADIRDAVNDLLGID